MSRNLEAVYNRIGTGYDNTRQADPNIISRLINHLGVPSNEKILDLACGTGNYSIALSEAGFKVSGVDASERMIEAAKLKSRSVNWYFGDANALPFADGAFNGAICTLAIHHFDSLEKPFAEVFRVLKSGNFVIFTSTPEQMRGYWLNEYFPLALKKSLVQMPSLIKVKSALELAGFFNVRTEIYEVQPDLKDKFLYSGKQTPCYYLDTKVRAGISTFSSLADPSEVTAGCQKLKRDIDAGRVNKVIENYKHQKGDYLFVIATKGL